MESEYLKGWDLGSKPCNRGLEGWDLEIRKDGI